MHNKVINRFFRPSVLKNSYLIRNKSIIKAAPYNNLIFPDNKSHQFALESGSSVHYEGVITI